MTGHVKGEEARVLEASRHLCSRGQEVSPVKTQEVSRGPVVKGMLGYP